MSSIPKLVLKLLYKLVLKDDASGTLSNGAMESIAFPLEQCLILYETLLKNHYTLPPSLRNTQKTTDNCFKVIAIIAQLEPHVYLISTRTRTCNVRVHMTD